MAKVKYIKGDLFSAPQKVLLAHSISSDARMGAGIAKQFAAIYPDDVRAMQDNWRLFGESKNQVGTNYYSIYSGSKGVRDKRHDVVHMYAKTYANKKPKNHDGLYDCLEELLEFAQDGGYTSIALPLVGAGLDAIKEKGKNGSDWKEIEYYINMLFENTNIEVTVYYL